MADEKKCCQAFSIVADKIKSTAKVIDGKVYLDQLSRKYLTD